MSHSDRWPDEALGRRDGQRGVDGRGQPAHRRVRRVRPRWSVAHDRAMRRGADRRREADPRRRAAYAEHGPPHRGGHADEADYVHERRSRSLGQHLRASRRERLGSRTRPSRMAAASHSTTAPRSWAVGEAGPPVADPVLFVDHVTITKSRGTGIWLQQRSTFLAGSKDLTITASGGDEAPYPLEISEQAIDAIPTGTYRATRRTRS